MTPDELEAVVTRMRALGVTKFGDIELGPTPAPVATEPSHEEKTRRREAKEEHERDVMFAHSHVRPALRSTKP